jgi:hypothetical protein
MNNSLPDQLHFYLKLNAVSEMVAEVLTGRGSTCSDSWAHHRLEAQSN